MFRQFFFSGLDLLAVVKNIGHLSIDVNDGDREKLLMPLSNESELSMAADNPSALFMIILGIINMFNAYYYY